MTDGAFPITSIEHFVDMIAPPPEDWWDRASFMQRSTERSAVYDILERITTHPHLAPESIIENYILETEAMKYNARSPKLIAIAIESQLIAEDLLLYLQGLNL